MIEWIALVVSSVCGLLAVGFAIDAVRVSRRTVRQWRETIERLER